LPVTAWPPIEPSTSEDHVEGRRFATIAKTAMLAQAVKEPLGGLSDMARACQRPDNHPTGSAPLERRGRSVMLPREGEMKLSGLKPHAGKLRIVLEEPLGVEERAESDLLATGGLQEFERLAEAGEYRRRSRHKEPSRATLVITGVMPHSYLFDSQYFRREQSYRGNKLVFTSSKFNSL
jgi:hypothetical protein